MPLAPGRDHLVRNDRKLSRPDAILLPEVRNHDLLVALPRLAASVAVYRRSAPLLERQQSAVACWRKRVGKSGKCPLV